MQKFNRKLLMLLSGVSLLLFTGCKKEAITKSSSAVETVSSPRANSDHAAPKAVHILAVYSPANFPNVSGTFTTWGALGDNVSGTTTMDIGLLTPTGMVAHCKVVLTFYNPDQTVKGTITLKQECEFASQPVYPNNKGQWQIVEGTGAYTGIRGNGITTMPPPLDEDMTGVIL